MEAMTIYLVSKTVHTNSDRNQQFRFVLALRMFLTLRLLHKRKYINFGYVRKSK